MVKDHYCWEVISKDCCGVEFVQDESIGGGKWFPLVHYRDPSDDSVRGTIRLGNIHWHSKKTEFMENSCADNVYQKPLFRNNQHFWKWDES